MTYSDTCPPCGKVFTGEDPQALATEVVQHASVAHNHELTREHVLAHLVGENPHGTEP